MVNIAYHLQEYHQEGIILRFISPENVYVSDNNNVFFSDWTLAQKKGKSIDQTMMKDLSLKFDFIKNNAKAE